METISFDNPESLKVDPIVLHKMAFLYNALENGWNIKKHNNPHENKKEVYLDDYLKRFMKENLDINNIKFD